MAKRGPVLKWRKVKGEWRAGPFKVNLYGGYLETSKYYTALVSNGSVWQAKSACERLARRIIAATRKASQ